MKNRSMAIAVGTLALLGLGHATWAGPIYWTPSSSGTSSQLTYSDGQSDNGLYGNPTVVGTTFQFLTPHDFNSTASSSAGDTTSDRLSFVVNAKPGEDFDSVNITEHGSWSILGTGALKDSGGLLVTNLTPGHFGVTYSITPTVTYTNTDTGAVLVSPSMPADGGVGTWKASYFLPLPAGITSMQIVLNNTLQTAAGPVSTAFIDKQDVSITAVEFASVPEPASMAGLILGGIAALRRRRSKSA